MKIHRDKKIATRSDTIISITDLERATKMLSGNRSVTGFHLPDAFYIKNNVL